LRAFMRATSWSATPPSPDGTDGLPCSAPSRGQRPPKIIHR
jgi:hypothetical protein